MVILASGMTKDQIVTRIEEAISDYKEAKLIGNVEDMDVKLHFLAMSCNLLLMNIVTDGDITKALGTIKKMQRMRDRDKIFSVDDKQN